MWLKLTNLLFNIHDPFSAHQIHSFYLKNKSRIEHISCLNFWDKAWRFLSFGVFGLLSSSLLYSQRFSLYLLQPSSGVSWTQELIWTLNHIPYLIHGGRLFWFCLPWPSISAKYFCIVTLLQSRLNLQPPDDCLFRSLGNQHLITIMLCVLLDNSEWIFVTYKLNVLTSLNNLRYVSIHSLLILFLFKLY